MAQVKQRVDKILIRNWAFTCKALFRILSFFSCEYWFMTHWPRRSERFMFLNGYRALCVFFLGGFDLGQTQVPYVDEDVERLEQQVALSDWNSHASLLLVTQSKVVLLSICCRLAKHSFIQIFSNPVLPKYCMHLITIFNIQETTPNNY